MNLSEFFDYKNQFFSDVIKNEKLIKLINEDKTLETAESLMYTQLYPYEYIPETVEHGYSFVCCEVGVQASMSRTNNSVRMLYKPVLDIWVLVHKSKLRLPEGGVRFDAICSEIADTINESLFYGIKGLRLYSVKPFSPATDYKGKVMSFVSDDINWFYDPTRPVPANRKRGE